MSNVIHKSIPVVNLLINTENPRFDMVENQREAISKMIENQGSKLIKLAKDIIDFGLNPTKYICVTQDSKKKTHYNVLEGNRRITTLKILNNPEIIDEEHKSFIRSIKKLSETFKKNPIDSVNCAVFPNSDDGLKWIELEHTGQNDGVGVVEWNATQKARFDKRVKGTTPLALQVIELLERSEFTPKRIKQELPSLTISNIERLLGDPDVRELLSLKVQDKKLITEIAEKELIKGLSKIASDFLFNQYTVYDIDKKKDRAKYLESFQPNEMPDKTKKSNGPWHLISSPDSVTKLPTTILTKKKNQPLSHERKKLIPISCILSIQEDNRINAIYVELKRLDTEEFTNATSVLFRVFIELSVDAFIAKKRGKIFQGINKSTSLKDKIEKVAQYFEDSQLLNEEQLRGIRVCVNTKHSIFSIDTFNAYVHNRHISPIATDLKITWDNIQIFVEKIWETIK